MEKLVLMFVAISLFFASCRLEDTQVTESAIENKTSPNRIIEKYENTVFDEVPFRVNIDGNMLEYCINDYNRDFRDLYEHNESNKFFDSKNRFLPYTEIESQFDEYNIYYKMKSYKRITCSDDKILETKKINRTLHSFEISIKNLDNKKVTLKSFPIIKVIFEDENGNEFFDKNRYTNKNGQTEFTSQPVYLYPSKNQESKNYNDYLSLDLPAGKTKKITLKYVVDNDLYTSSYLCFKDDDGNKYFKLYNY